MSKIWDIKTDAVKRGDNARDVSPLTGKTKTDEKGFTHYVFSRVMFNNPWYEIPEDNFELFKKFLEGGSRQYPSDGEIPCDIVAKEAREVLNYVVEISHDSNNHFYKDAQEALKDGKHNLVRGTMKLYLAKYPHAIGEENDLLTILISGFLKWNYTHMR